MDYEKKYKDANDKVAARFGTNVAKEIFTDLYESEDERIRKEIMDFIDTNTIDSDERRDRWLAWLEKQGDANKEYWRGYREGKKEILDKYSELEKQVKQNQKHFELKAGHWYICHRAYCCRADHLTVKEGERFMCEKDGIVKGFVIKEPEKYFKEVCAPAPIEDEQKPAWSEEDERWLMI